MANTSSAKKAVRQTKTRTKRNAKQKQEMKKLMKELETLVENGEKEKAEKLLPTVTKKIDKAAKNNIIHKNAAARYKSRLAKKVNTTKKPVKEKTKTKKK